MKQKSPIVVLLLGFVTVGIYSWYWFIKTKGEMNSKGEKIPTAWIWLIPGIGTLWWDWEYSQGVEHVTNKSVSGIVAFLFLLFLGPIGQAIIQSSFNKITESASVAPVQPAYTQPTYDQPVVDNTPAPTIEPVATTPVQPTYTQPVVETPIQPTYSQPVVAAPMQPTYDQPTVDTTPEPTLTTPSEETPPTTPYGPSAV